MKKKKNPEKSCKNSRIAQLRNKIESGSYSMPSKEVARVLIKQKLV